MNGNRDLKQPDKMFLPQIPRRNLFLAVLAVFVAHAIIGVATFDIGWELGVVFSFREVAIETVLFVLVLTPVLYFTLYRPMARSFAASNRWQANIAESEERYRFVSQTANDAIIVIKGPSSAISMWNKKAEEMFGYASDEAIGRDLHRLIVPERYHENACAGLKRFFAVGEGAVIGKTLEVSALRKDGSEFPVELSIAAMKIGDEWQATGIIRDIVVRKQMEADLKKSEKQLLDSQKLAGIGQLTDGVCHEILNPINIISLQVQMLSRQRSEDKDLMACLDKMKQQIRRVTQITDTLLLFSRRGSGVVETVQIEAELNATLSLVEKDYFLDNIFIVRNFEPGLPQMRVNPDEIRQVFLNIVGNAKDAMAGGGTLTVSVQKVREHVGELVRIKFSDTGVGIKKENLGNIFNPFFSAKTGGTGMNTGMGLAVAHTLVEKNGGTIGVESEEGKGAAFTIDLPVATEIASGQRPSQGL